MLADWWLACLIFDVFRFVFIPRKMFNLVHDIVGDTFVKVKGIKFYCDFVRLVEPKW